MAKLQDLAQLKECLERQELTSGYSGVINIQQALQSGWQGGDTAVIVDEGIDERNGSYSYEVHVEVYPSTYLHDVERGHWVASRTYSGGLNRLGDDGYEYFDSQKEAIEFVKQHWF